MAAAEVDVWVFRENWTRREEIACGWPTTEPWTKDDADSSAWLALQLRLTARTWVEQCRRRKVENQRRLQGSYPRTLSRRLMIPTVTPKRPLSSVSTEQTMLLGNVDECDCSPSSTQQDPSSTGATAQRRPLDEDACTWTPTPCNIGSGWPLSGREDRDEILADPTLCARIDWTSEEGFLQASRKKKNKASLPPKSSHKKGNEKKDGGKKDGDKKDGGEGGHRDNNDNGGGDGGGSDGDGGAGDSDNDNAGGDGGEREDDDGGDENKDDNGPNPSPDNAWANNSIAATMMDQKSVADEAQTGGGLDSLQDIKLDKDPSLHQHSGGTGDKEIKTSPFGIWKLGWNTGSSIKTEDTTKRDTVGNLCSFNRPNTKTKTTFSLGASNEAGKVESKLRSQESLTISHDLGALKKADKDKHNRSNDLAKEEEEKKVAAKKPEPGPEPELHKADARETAERQSNPVPGPRPEPEPSLEVKEKMDSTGVNAENLPVESNAGGGNWDLRGSGKANKKARDDGWVNCYQELKNKDKASDAILDLSKTTADVESDDSLSCSAEKKDSTNDALKLDQIERPSATDILGGSSCSNQSKKSDNNTLLEVTAERSLQSKDVWGGKGTSSCRVRGKSRKDMIAAENTPSSPPSPAPTPSGPYLLSDVEAVADNFAPEANHVRDESKRPEKNSKRRELEKLDKEKKKAEKEKENRKTQEAKAEKSKAHGTEEQMARGEEKQLQHEEDKTAAKDVKANLAAQEEAELAAFLTKNPKRELTEKDQEKVDRLTESIDKRKEESGGRLADEERAEQAAREEEEQAAGKTKQQAACELEEEAARDAQKRKKAEATFAAQKEEMATLEAKKIKRNGKLPTNDKKRLDYLIVSVNKREKEKAACEANDEAVQKTQEAVCEAQEQAARKTEEQAAREAKEAEEQAAQEAQKTEAAQRARDEEELAALKKKLTMKGKLPRKDQKNFDRLTEKIKKRELDKAAVEETTPEPISKSEGPAPAPDLEVDLKADLGAAALEDMLSRNNRSTSDAFNFWGASKARSQKTSFYDSFPSSMPSTHRLSVGLGHVTMAVSQRGLANEVELAAAKTSMIMGRTDDTGDVDADKAALPCLDGAPNLTKSEKPIGSRIANRLKIFEPRRDADDAPAAAANPLVAVAPLPPSVEPPTKPELVAPPPKEARKPKQGQVSKSKEQEEKVCAVHQPVIVEEQPVAKSSPSPKNQDVPGTFPIDDDEIVDLVEVAPKTKSKKSAKAVADPVPPPAPPPPPAVPDEEDVLTPRPEPKPPSKKDRTKIIRDTDSSWCAWGVTPTKDVKVSKSAKARSEKENDSSSLRKKSSDKDDKGSSKASTSDKVEKAARAEKPPLPRLVSVLTSTPPLSCSESRRGKRHSESGRSSRRHSVEVDLTNGLASAPSHSDEVRETSSKAVKTLGIGTPRSASKPSKRRSEGADDDDLVMVDPTDAHPSPDKADRRKSKKRPRDEDVVMVDMADATPASLRRSHSSAKKPGFASLFGVAFSSPRPDPPRRRNTRADAEPQNVSATADADQEARRARRAARRAEKEAEQVRLEEARRAKEESRREKRKRLEEVAEAKRKEEREARRAERRAQKQRQELERERRVAEEAREAREAERTARRRSRKEREASATAKGAVDERRERHRGRAPAVDDSGREDDKERRRRREARRAAKEAEASGTGRSSHQRSEDVGVGGGRSSWPHSGTSTWVKEHADAGAPPEPEIIESGETEMDSAAYPPQRELEEEEAARKERRARRRAARAAMAAANHGDQDAQPEWEREQGSHGRSHSHSHRVRDRERDQDCDELRSRRKRRQVRVRARDRDEERERPRLAKVGGSEGGSAERKGNFYMDNTPRNSWWKKLTGN